MTEQPLQLSSPIFSRAFESMVLTQSKMMIEIQGALYEISAKKINDIEPKVSEVIELKCPLCDGTGMKNNRKCPGCGGEGVRKEVEKKASPTFGVKNRTLPGNSVDNRISLPPQVLNTIRGWKKR